MTVKYCKSLDEAVTQTFEYHDYTELLTDENGCTAGCRTGVLSYWQTEYIQGGIHEDQEGFFVLEGYGMALIGDCEFPIGPGSCFIAPAGVSHYIRRNADCSCVRLFFFHAAAQA